jgi:hypothetical protein
MNAFCSVMHSSTTGMPMLLQVIGLPSAQVSKGAYSALHRPVLYDWQVDTQEAWSGGLFGQLAASVAAQPRSQIAFPLSGVGSSSPPQAFVTETKATMHAAMRTLMPPKLGRRAPPANGWLEPFGGDVRNSATAWGAGFSRTSHRA